ncbi:MAG: S-layer homology domain-containing protein [Acidimicrobiales bacterium]|nr:S-layer homology domain-containing protein [Acidimicrobiales bacterium]
MLTHLRKRTALLLSVAVVCATVALVPQTASAAQWAPAALGNDTAGNVTGYRACPAGSASAAGFTDTTSTDVDCIKMFGITQGKTATTYDPSASVTREEMALFLSRMYTPTGLAAGTTAFTAFTDISGLEAASQTAINAIAASGITVGTNVAAGTFSPADNVTREQMAIFLNRMADLLKDSDTNNDGTAVAIAGTVVNGGYNYTDIGSTSHEGLRAIVRLYDLGIPNACSVALSATCDTTYRPTADITRLEMAQMMVGLLNHSNARPAGISIQSPVTNVAGATMTSQISARNADFTPNANVSVEVIAQKHNDTPGVAAVVPFHPLTGLCNTSNVIATGTECAIDATDAVTTALGNAGGPSQTAAALHTLNWWAWTGADAAVYVNDTTVAFHHTNNLGAASTVVPATTATLTTTARAKATADSHSADDDVTDSSGEITPFGESVTLTVTLTGATAAAVVDGYSVTFHESRVDKAGNVAISSTAVISAAGKASYTVAASADPNPAITGDTKLGDWASSEVTITMAGTGTGAATGTYQPLGYQGTAVSFAAGTLTDGGYNTSWSDALPVYTTASDTLAISQNTAVVSTAGTIVDATATAYDQYGRGIAGQTAQFAVDGVAKITATTGANGTAVYSFVACTANGVDAVSGTAAGTMFGGGLAAAVPAAAGVEGTTVYCTTAGVDGGVDAYGLGDHAAVAEVQVLTITGSPTGGTFTVTYNGVTSGDIAFDATGATISGIFDGLSNIQAGKAVAPNPASQVYTVTWNADHGNIPQMSCNGAGLTGGTSPACAGTTTTQGVGLQTMDFIDEDSATNTLVMLRTRTDGTVGGVTAATPTYWSYTYDSTDYLAITGTTGATEAQFEVATTAVANLTSEVGGTYRIASTGSGISVFVLTN